jgi:hypothetical protein
MTIEEAKSLLGAGVVYKNGNGSREDGVITSVNNTWVFVRYRGDNHSKATDPSQLEKLVADR